MLAPGFAPHGGGLLFGATVPYLFAAWTMKGVGVSAMAMVREIERQFQTMDLLSGVAAQPVQAYGPRLCGTELLLPGPSLEDLPRAKRPVGQLAWALNRFKNQFSNNIF